MGQEEAGVFGAYRTDVGGEVGDRGLDHHPWFPGSTPPGVDLPCNPNLHVPQLKVRTPVSSDNSALLRRLSPSVSSDLTRLGQGLPLLSIPSAHSGPQEELWVCPKQQGILTREGHDQLPLDKTPLVPVHSGLGVGRASESGMESHL